jgi:tetratricopeptide (TPR) repeat protein
VILAAIASVLCAPTIASAQETGGQWVLIDAEGSALVRQGSEAMYNLRYAEADSIFNILIQRQPDHPVGYFMQALVDWWRIVPNSSVDSKVSELSKSFNSRLDKVIEICDAKLEKNSSDIVGLFFKGSALGYRARLLVMGSFDASSVLDWVSAATSGKDAYDLILRCQRLAPSNSDILLGSGLYNYLGAYIPEQFPLAKPALSFLPPGDKKIGLSMLRISGERATYAATEARYALLEILSLWEKQYDEGVQVASELHAQYPGNSVFYRFLARNLYMTKDFVRADSMYVDILHRVERREPGYELTLARQGLYYLGDIRLRRGMFDDAVEYFQQADKLSHRFGEEETGWNVMSNLRMGLAYDRLGKRPEAIRQYKKVLDMDNNGDSHAQAEKYLKTAYNGNN